MSEFIKGFLFGIGSVMIIFSGIGYFVEAFTLTINRHYFVIIGIILFYLSLI